MLVCHEMASEKHWSVVVFDVGGVVVMETLNMSASSLKTGLGLGYSCIRLTLERH